MKRGYDDHCAGVVITLFTSKRVFYKGVFLGIFTTRRMESISFQTCNFRTCSKFSVQIRICRFATTARGKTRRRQPVGFCGGSCRFHTGSARSHAGSGLVPVGSDGFAVAVEVAACLNVLKQDVCCTTSEGLDDVCAGGCTADGTRETARGRTRRLQPVGSCGGSCRLQAGSAQSHAGSSLVPGGSNGFALAGKVAARLNVSKQDVFCTQSEGLDHVCGGVCTADGTRETARRRGWIRPPL